MKKNQCNKNKYLNNYKEIGRPMKGLVKERIEVIGKNGNVLNCYDGKSPYRVFDVHHVEFGV